MGFMDKLQQTAKESFEKGKEKLEDVQSDRAADKLLLDLGKWYYASRTGRDDGAAAEHMERLVGELQAHEAQYGQLGAEKEPAAPAAPSDNPFTAPTAAPAPPAAPVADAPPAPPAAAAPPPPPAPAAPVTDGPPPPPPA